MSGLQHLAHEVRSAGRGPDRHLVHLSDAELRLLRHGWGEPDVNPITGLPEYGWFDSIAQVLPAALSAFFPSAGTGIGEALGASGPWASVLGSGLLGAGSGLLTSGGDWKKALMGGAMGAGSAALFPYLANELAGTDVGNWLGIAGGNNTVFGDAPQGRMLAQYFGGDAGSRLDSYAADPAFSGPATGALASAASGMTTGGGRAGSGGDSGGSSSLLKYALPAVTLMGILSGNKGQAGGAPPTTTGTGSSGQGLPKLELAMKPKDTSGIDWYSYGQRPKTGSTFFDQEWKDAQGKTIGASDGGYVSMYADGGAVEGRPDDQLRRLLAELAMSSQSHGQGGMPDGYARGGQGSRYVGPGPGSGRQDMIPARLSPNEYVLDSSFVSDLGDGNPDEGARRLDKMRVNLRKHKGRAMAKGRISPNAKPPEAYLMGGRT